MPRQWTPEQRAALSAKAKARAASTIRSPRLVAPGAPDPLAQILDQLAKVGERLSALEQGASQYRPMQKPEGVGYEPTAGTAEAPLPTLDDLLVRPGEPLSGVRQSLPTTSHGPMDAAMVNKLRRRFKQKQRVRINPDAVREGAFEWTEKEHVDPRDGTVKTRRIATKVPRTWGTILASLGIDGIGEIRQCEDWSPRNHQWKYKVIVPGLTRAIGDGFYEYELLPA